MATNLSENKLISCRIYPVSGVAGYPGNWKLKYPAPENGQNIVLKA